MEHVTQPYQPLTIGQLTALHSNLSADRVATRKVGKKNLSYLEGWEVKAALIRVFGYASFSAECLDSKILRAEQVSQKDGDGTNWSISAQATYRLTIHQTGAVYTESAIATGNLPDWGESADAALKSAQTDALKRCATYLGTQFGLSLYDSGRLVDIITTTLAPEQADIMADINLARTNSPESQAAIARLQARLKVHKPTVTEAPTTVSEPTMTEVPVATVTAPPVVTVTPPAVAVAKALENADREAEKIDQAEKAAAKKRRPAPRRGARNTEDGVYGDDSARGRVTADRQALARQALMDAEQRTGTVPSHYGPSEEDYAMDDARQIAEDSAR